MGLGDGLDFLKWVFDGLGFGEGFDGLISNDKSILGFSIESGAP